MSKSTFQNITSLGLTCTS